MVAEVKYFSQQYRIPEHAVALFAGFIIAMSYPMDETYFMVLKKQLEDAVEKTDKALRRSETKLELVKDETQKS